MSNVAPMDDWKLLNEFAQRHTEEAFRTLVERHVDFVYSVALRQLRNPHTAEEVTQSVFIDLAAKAERLPRGTVLSGWLFRAVRFAASKVVRAEVRRQRWEREAAEMEPILHHDEVESHWQQMEPALNEALDELSDSDRSALLLRFFEKKPLKEIGDFLGLNEDAAKKRVSRALERLRGRFQKRGIAVSSAALLAALSAQTAQAAPSGLAAKIAGAAVLKGATLSSSTFTLGKGILKLMALSKLKTAVISTAAILIVGGTGTYVVHKKWTQPAADEDAALRILNSMNSGELQKAPPMVYLGRWKPGTMAGASVGVNGKSMARGIPPSELLAAAYGISQSRLLGLEDQAGEKWNYLVSLPAGQGEALQQAIREKLGLTAHRDTSPRDVYVMAAHKGDYDGLQPSAGGNGTSVNVSDGSLQFSNCSIDDLAQQLERSLGRPVINETELEGRFDVQLSWEESPTTQAPEAIRTAVEEQLGLGLVPDHRPVEVLVVEKAGTGSAK